MKADILKDEIYIELQELEIIVGKLSEIYIDFLNKEPDIIIKTAATSFTAQFYSGIENILKRISKYYNIQIPIGEDWHIELFKRFCSPQYLSLPVIFDDYLKEELANYRRFRHFVFHGYSSRITWDILCDGIKEVDKVYKNFKLKLNEILNLL